MDEGGMDGWMDDGEIITWITTIGSFFTEYNSGVGFKLLFEIFVKGV